MRIGCAMLVGLMLATVSGALAGPLPEDDGGTGADAPGVVSEAPSGFHPAGVVLRGTLVPQVTDEGRLLPVAPGVAAVDTDVYAFAYRAAEDPTGGTVTVRLAGVLACFDVWAVTEGGRLARASGDGARCATPDAEARFRVFVVPRDGPVWLEVYGEGPYAFALDWAAEPPRPGLWA